MEKIIIWYVIVALGVFMSSCSQVILKKSAVKKHDSIIMSMLNCKVMSAYLIFFLAMFANVMAMSKGVDLKDLPIMESMGYVFVPILSKIVLHEDINKRMWLSIFVIMCGIAVFYA